MSGVGVGAASSRRTRAVQGLPLGVKKVAHLYRELGFSLKHIKGILGRPDFEQRAALQGHREVLTEGREAAGEPTPRMGADVAG